MDIVVVVVVVVVVIVVVPLRHLPPRLKFPPQFPPRLNSFFQFPKPF